MKFRNTEKTAQLSISVNWLKSFFSEGSSKHFGELSPIFVLFDHSWTVASRFGIFGWSYLPCRTHRICQGLLYRWIGFFFYKGQAYKVTSKIFWVSWAWIHVVISFMNSHLVGSSIYLSLIQRSICSWTNSVHSWFSDFLVS